MSKIPALRKCIDRGLALLAVAVLAACGGGGSDTAAVDTTVAVNTKVIDGAIQNAIVCLDKNDNGACDAGEPSGRTDASGAVTLSVDRADAGKFPLLAMVGTDAVDADHGPVITPYRLSTTADMPGFITPLTTLVKAQVDGNGFSRSDAEKALQSQLSTSTSLFDDYTATGGSASLATLARLVTLVRQQVFSDVQSAVGTADSSGSTITQQDLQRAIDQRLIDELQTLATALGSDEVRNALDAQSLETALQSQARSLAAGGLSIDAVTAVGSARQAAAATIPAQGAPAAFFSIRWLTYTDPNNWFFRAFSQTAEQATPDANGKTRFIDERKRATAGVIQSWGDAQDFTQVNVYWTGSQWFACPVSHQHIATPRDAKGEGTSLYCESYSGKSMQLSRDISGRSIAGVVAEIRAYAGKDALGLYSQWGPDPSLPALAGLTFPSGSALYYQAGIEVSNPIGYDPAATNVVTVAPQSSVAALAAGDQRPCSQAGAFAPTSAATLGVLIASSRGGACIGTPTDETGPRNEGAWGSTTVSLGLDVPASLPGGNPYYRASRALRVGFGSGNTATFYRCLRRASDNSTRNCDAIGTGTYVIDINGDGRTLRFSNLPADTAQYSFERVFVERNGAVYYGFRSKLQVSNTLRLSTAATEALLAALGISR